MEEEEIQSSLNTYKGQLQQVEQALRAAGSNTDLETLKNDLTELVNLTQESLLSLKKSKLLKQLDEDSADYSRFQTKGANPVLQVNSPSHSGAPSIDEEYAAFQEFLGDIEDEKTTENDKELPVKENIGGKHSVSEMYKEIIGTKCQAPFSQDWGHKSYGNALIVGVESEIETEIPKVKVMFCNPTHQSMLPCTYFLSGSCRFDQDQCRFSHGYAVPLEELKEYVDHDHSELKLESKCLARFHDDLWYKATVVDLHDSGVTVTFDSYQDDPVPLPWEGVIPLPDMSDELSSSSKEGTDDDVDDDITEVLPIDREESDDDDALPVFLWKPSSHGLGDLGRWEEHTKGIGSRLLQKMGYVPGQGLGCRGEGRVEPVPIQLLPQGKSLDRIMTLKELAGDRDIFDAMKQQERKDRKMVRKLEQQYHKLESRPDVFEFINKRLGGKKGKLSELVHEHQVQGHSKSNKDGRLHRSISEIDLKAKSDKNLNIQLLKTSEEMKTVEKELVKLKQSLNRNENRDKNIATKIRTKISSLEAYLNKLKSSEAAIESHKQKRTDHKNLTIF